MSKYLSVSQSSSQGDDSAIQLMDSKKQEPAKLKIPSSGTDPITFSDLKKQQKNQIEFFEKRGSALSDSIQIYRSNNPSIKSEISSSSADGGNSRDGKTKRKDRRSTKSDNRRRGSGRNISYADRLLQCMSRVPKRYLATWLGMLFGLGALTASSLVGLQNARGMIGHQDTFDLIENVIPGVIISMFIVSTILLCVGHLTADRGSRSLLRIRDKMLNTKKMKRMILVLSSVFGVLWIMVSTLFVFPITYLVLLLVINDDPTSTTLHLEYYGLSERELTGHELMYFVRDGKDLLYACIAAYISSLLITVCLTTGCVESGMVWHATKPGLTTPLDLVCPAPVQSRDNTTIVLINAFDLTDSPLYWEIRLLHNCFTQKYGRRQRRYAMHRGRTR